MQASVLLEGRKAWAAQSPDAPAWPNGPTRNQYVDGMCRPTGSFVRIKSNVLLVNNMPALEGLFNAMGNIDAYHQTAESMPAGTWQEGHDYWFVPVPEGYDAFQAIALVKNLSESQLETVRIRKSKHGYELQSDAIQPVQTQFITLIADNDGLVTWFPGTPTTPMNYGEATVKFIS